MATTSSDFATVLCAGMAGVSVEKYKEHQQWMLDNLDKIEAWVKGVKVNDDATFDTASACKSALSSLFCYTANNKLPEFDRVCDIEYSIGRKMRLYVEKSLAPPAENVMIRYILANRAFHNDDEMRVKILDHLVEKGYVFIRPATEHDFERIVVTGIACKTGDNTFSISGHNRHHRQYVKVCLPQCYCLRDKDIEYLRTKKLPTLEKEMSLTGFGDGKYLARYPKFNRREFYKLREDLVSSK